MNGVVGPVGAGLARDGFGILGKLRRGRGSLLQRDHRKIYSMKNSDLKIVLLFGKQIMQASMFLLKIVIGFYDFLGFLGSILN